MKNRFFTSSRQKKTAFTLPEVIVAMGILVMVIMSSTDLLVSITRSNNINSHTLVAFELAQEGLEGIRNIRDSNWLLNADFSGKISSKTGSVTIWGAGNGTVAFPEVGQTSYYLLDYNRLNSAAGSDVLTSASQLADYAPWKLTQLSTSSSVDPELDKNVGILYVKKFGSNQDQVQYVHDGLFAQDAKSIYRRIIRIEAFGYDQKNDGKVYKYRVTSSVFWDEDRQEKNVRLTAELTDWKGGPL